ncbi:MAG: 4Fe-4S dicluster domain-containing protein [Gammaproteobacteria bacterium]|nr:4Fe-4S dicluster domain-containing protein [Gammaproteobacteria bacterium]MCP5135371.1 4Fe-4S dicluster domain-containing protein [Gammaproteobacteria bacterium]
MNPSRRAFFRRIAGADHDRGAPVRRPPWALTEAEFVARCTRCDLCVQACPERVLQRGDGGFPEIVFTHGGCDFCAECAAVCEPRALDRDRRGAAFGWVATIGDACLSRRGVECRIGFYTASTDTSKKRHTVPRRCSCRSEESSARSSSAKLLS